MEYLGERCSHVQPLEKLIHIRINRLQYVKSFRWKLQDKQQQSIFAHKLLLECKQDDISRDEKNAEKETDAR